jgi:RsiW-degrading membrane proteinase PrsW (M82 family)
LSDATGAGRALAAPRSLGWRARAPRYTLAAVIGGVVFAALIVSLLLSVSIPLPGWFRLLLGAGAIALIALETVLIVRGLGDDSAVRRRRLLRSAVVLVAAAGLWLVAANVYLVSRAAGAGPAALATAACLPTTAFGLWFVHRLDRNEKEPWRLVLTATAWGGIVATTLAAGFERAWIAASLRSLLPGPGLDISVSFSAGFFEELGKGVAVLLLFLLMREEFDDVVDGIVYGAAVGLGFNFIESISYMTSIYGTAGPQGAFDQWLQRQVLDLFFGHATFTALLGAAIGVARQTRNLAAAVILVVSGWVAAIAAHFAFDLLHLLQLSTSAFTTWPFTAVVVILLVLGLRTEGRALERHLHAEAAEHPHVVNPEEIPFLLGPSKRLRARIAALRAGGPRDYLRQGRLQAVLLELALARWHAEREELDPDWCAETQAKLRRLALELRGG